MGNRGIFVLGCDRSGTSLLRRIFNAHPRIACPSETKFIYQFVKVYETYHSLTGLQNMGFDEQEILERMKNFICYFLDNYAKRNNKKIWIEKTTHNVNCISTIDKIFNKKATYIAIIRHGLDVAYSLSTLKFDKFTVIDKYRYDAADTPLASIRHWSAMNQKIVEFSEIVKNRMIIIKYEDLTSEPRKIIKEICSFIGEVWDESMLNYNQKIHDSGWEDPNAVKLPSIIKNSGKYKNWPLTLQKRLFNEAHDMFDYFSYEF
ncbi:MAG: sulfotransferase [Victivallales bacterium]|nr:sulfotransferase [Victivallales bacterium]